MDGRRNCHLSYARAPERRLFYIDVGNLPKAKAEQYLRDVMARYRTKISYDQNTGQIKDDKKYMSMLEDYWLPRREGGRGTEVSTLPGGQNLGELEDLKYFQEKLYRSLNVHLLVWRRVEGFQIGQSDTTSRDEIKFAKFVGRMRKKFSLLFVDLLKTQLVLKGVVSPKEYDQMKEHIQFDYIYDNHYAELKEIEMMNNRLQLAAMAEPYLGKYFSVYQVRNRLLNYTDGEIKEIDHQISYERNVGIIPDPNAAMQQEEEQPAQQDPNAPIEGDMDLSGDFQQPPPVDPNAMAAAGGGGASTMPSPGGGMGGGLGPNASPF